MRPEFVDGIEVTTAVWVAKQYTTWFLIQLRMFKNVSDMSMIRQLVKYVKWPILRHVDVALDSLRRRCNEPGIRRLDVCILLDRTRT